MQPSDEPPLASSNYALHLVSLTRPLTGLVRTRAHRHSFYELAFLGSGHAEWHIKGRPRVRLASGQAIVIGPEEEHFETAAPSHAGSVFAWLGFTAPSEALRGVPLHTALSLHGWSESLTATLQLLLLENVNRGPEFELRLRLLTADALLQLRRACGGLAPPQPLGLTRDDLEAARLYIEKNAEEELTMEQVARYHGLSLSHLEALFRRRFGTSPKQYQQRVRRQRVEKSLLAGVSSPKELAARHNFRDAAYFCRWFKRQMGVTPSEYAARLSLRGRTS